MDTTQHGRPTPVTTVIAMTAAAGKEHQARTRLLGVDSLLDEHVLLATCERTEIYAATTDAHRATRPLRFVLGDDATLLTGGDVARHLFRVASGLESAIIGEPHILGQVRRARLAAQDEGCAGPVLSELFAGAIRTGRAVRARTALGTQRHGIGRRVGDHLARQLGSLEGRAGVVVGTGEAARDVVEVTGERGARLAIAGRDRAKAKHLTLRAPGATAHDLGEVSSIAARANFVVVAVSGGSGIRFTIPAESTLVVIDVSVPRVVKDAPGLSLHTLEDLPRGDAFELVESIRQAELIISDACAPRLCSDDRRAAFNQSAR